MWCRSLCLFGRGVEWSMRDMRLRQLEGIAGECSSGDRRYLVTQCSCIKYNCFLWFTEAYCCRWLVNVDDGGSEAGFVLRWVDWTDRMKWTNASAIVRLGQIGFCRHRGTRAAAGYRSSVRRVGLLGSAYVMDSPAVYRFSGVLSVAPCTKRLSLCVLAHALCMRYCVFFHLVLLFVFDWPLARRPAIEMQCNACACGRFSNVNKSCVFMWECDRSYFCISHGSNGHRVEWFW